jgi:hypothetical protein
MAHCVGLGGLSGVDPSFFSLRRAEEMGRSDRKPAVSGAWTAASWGVLELLGDGLAGILVTCSVSLTCNSDCFRQVAGQRFVLSGRSFSSRGRLAGGKLAVPGACCGIGRDNWGVRELEEETSWGQIQVARAKTNLSIQLTVLIVIDDGDRRAERGGIRRLGVGG